MISFLKLPSARYDLVTFYFLFYRLKMAQRQGLIHGLVPPPYFLPQAWQPFSPMLTTPLVTAHGVPSTLETFTGPGIGPG